MTTTWTHPAAPNEAAERRPGADGRARRVPSLAPELPINMLAGAIDEVVEHPMTPEDVAALLRVDRETVYRMARRGELPAFKVSSRWRFLPSRLQRWMEEQETERH